MSIVKNKKIYISILLILISFFTFGCKKEKIKVDNIYFDLDGQKSITLVVGESYTPKVVFDPTHPTNADYYFSSSADDVVEISNKSILALKEGSSVLTVVAKDNELLMDFVTINVINEPTKLDIPILTYDSTNQMFNISEVPDSVGYTLLINENEISLGGVSDVSFVNLNNMMNQKYGETIYNKELTINVKANSYKFTQAYLDSDYSSQIFIGGTGKTKLYQEKDAESVQVKGGVLSFNSIANYQVKINGNLINVAPNISENKIKLDLTDLNPNLIGNKTKVELKVQAKVDESKKTNALTYYSDAKEIKLDVDVLGVPNISIQNSILTWNYVGNASLYHIELKNESNEVVGSYETSLNYYNLAENLNTGLIYKVDVYAEVSENALNTIKTKQISNFVKVVKLNSVELEVQNNEISWLEVENATMYSITIECVEDELTYKTNTLNTKFNLDNFASGKTYNIKVSAINTEVNSGEINYIASDFVQDEVLKQAKPTIKIEDSKLLIESKEGESYYVRITNGGLVTQYYTDLTKAVVSDVETEWFEEIQKDYIYDEILVTSSNLQEIEDKNYYVLNLLNNNYEVGEHVISVKRLGDNENVFDSDYEQKGFVQLEKITSLEINNNVALANRSTINELANISLVICDKSTESEVCHKDFTSGEVSYNLLDEKLEAGEYELRAYALGTGSLTLSCEEYEVCDFLVLASPSLTQINKDNSVLNFLEADAIKYHLLFDEEEVDVEKTDSSYDFELEIGEFVKFKVKSVGDGSNVVDSVYAEYTITKLNTPTLGLDGKNIVLENNNDEGFGFTEFCTLNDIEVQEEIETIDDLSLNPGENTLNYKLIANDIANGKIFVSSEEVTITINNETDSNKLEITEDNQLKIAKNKNEETIKVNFIVGEVCYTYLFGESGKLVDNSSVETLFVYTEDTDFYYVNLTKGIKDDYAQIDPLTNNFKAFIEIDEEKEEFNLTINLLYKDIMFESEATLSREAQTIKFENVKEVIDNFYDSYLLIVNDEPVNSIDLTTDGTNVVIEVEDLFDLENVNSDEVNTIRIVTLNTDASLKVISSEIKFMRINYSELSSTKSSTTNVREISFEINDLATKYVVTFTDKNGGSYEREYVNTDAVNSVISQDLDSILDINTLKNKLQISLQTITINKDTDNNVELFNSEISNVLSFDILEEVTKIKINDNKLILTNENVLGFNIYGVEGNNLIKLNTEGLFDEENVLDLTDCEYEYIKIRAISDDEDETKTNSKLSESFKIEVLNAPSFEVVNGDIVLSLYNKEYDLFKNFSLVTQTGVVVGITNGEANEIQFNFATDGVSKNDTAKTITIEAGHILNYEGNEISAENLKIRLVSLASSEKIEEQNVCYLSSSEIEETVYGLKKPDNLRQSQGIYGIIWNAISSCVINSEEIENLIKNYEFILTYNDKTYKSTDEGLYYLDSDNKVNYSNLTTKSLILPYGYEKEADGEDEAINEIFGAGEYKIKIRAKANKINGYKFCNSNYSVEGTFTVLADPILMTNDGNIVWKLDENAESYNIKLYTYSKPDEEIVEVEGDAITVNILSSNVFTLDGEKYIKYNLDRQASKVYGVACQAVSSNHISKYSKKYYMYKEAQVDYAMVEDGALIIKADGWFTFMDVELVDKDDNHITTLTYTNENPASFEEEEDWETLRAETPKQSYFVVKISDSDVLTITQGRTYRINVTLRGNTISNLTNNGVITSDKSLISDLSLYKLRNASQEISNGVLTFSNENNSNNINYKLGNASNFSQIPIYRINIVKYLGDTISNYEIYAVNYSEAENAGCTILSETSGVVELYKYINYPYNNSTIKVTALESIDFNQDKLYYIDLRQEFTLTELGYKFTYSNTGNQNIDLSQGGAFQIFITLVGGDLDEDTNIGCVSSNSLDAGMFIRYSNNIPGVIDGKLGFIPTLFKNSDGDVIAYPVYKLTIQKYVPGTGNVDFKTLYLYNPDLSEEEITNWSTAREVNLEDCRKYIYNPEDYPGYIIYDLSSELDAGYNYILTMKTLSGNETNSTKLLLDAPNPNTTASMIKPANVNFDVVNGTLTFNQVSYMIGASLNYITKYELTIGENVYIIDQTDSLITNGMKIDENHKVSLVFPLTFMIKNEENEWEESETIVSLVNTFEYSINIRALPNSFNNTVLLNGSYNDEPKDFKVSYGVENVRIENGEVQWDIGETLSNASYCVIVKFDDDSGKDVEILINNGQVNSYKIQESYLIGNNNYSIKSGVPYSIGVYQIDSGHMRSNISWIENVYKISNPSPKNINDNLTWNNEGKITWQQNNYAIQYKILIRKNSTSEQEEIIIDCEDYKDIDLRDYLTDEFFESGESYTITIQFIGDDMISSNVVTIGNNFEQLEVVDNTSIMINNGALTWAANNNATKYLVSFYNYENSTKGEQVGETVVCEINSYSPDSMEISGYLYVEIIAVGEGNYLLSNVSGAPVADGTENPQSVDSIEFMLDEDENETNTLILKYTNYVNGDKVRLIFNLNGEEFVLTSKLNINDEGEISVYDSVNKCFYYTLTTMGTYTDFKAQIIRSGAMNSGFYIASLGTKVLDDYASGSGTSEDAYIIETLDQLLNISKNPDKYFKITKDITIDTSNETIFANLAKGYIICEEFAGYLDGKTTEEVNGNNIETIHIIDGIEIENNTNKNVAIFGKIKNATVKNLQISSPIITKSFDSNVNDVVYLSILAGEVESSTIDYISITNAKITVTGSVSITKAVNIAAISVTAKGSTISNCSVDLVIDNSITYTSTSYNAAFVAKIENSTILNATSNLKVESVTNITYVGGLVAYVSSTVQVGSSVVITNLTNISVSNAGGVAGYVGENAELQLNNVSTSGELKFERVSDVTYVGGLVGSLRGVISMSNINNNNIILSNSSASSLNCLYVGKIAGYATNEFGEVTTLTKIENEYKIYPLDNLKDYGMIVNNS